MMDILWSKQSILKKEMEQDPSDGLFLRTLPPLSLQEDGIQILGVVQTHTRCSF